VSSLVNIAQKCSPYLDVLGAVFVERLKEALLITEMPCIRSDDNSHYCMDDIVRLRQASQDPGVNSQPTSGALDLYCTACIVKLFSAAATFAPDYARVQFQLMASFCWKFPDNGNYCVLAYVALAQESPTEAQSENGLSQAHLNLLCDPCVRIFLRRLAILYADPVLITQHYTDAVNLFKIVHAIDVLCLARAVGNFCIRELRTDLTDGAFAQILPVPGLPCYDSLVNQGSSSCPACAVNITRLLTEHGCCAIALFKIVDFLLFVNGNYSTGLSDNRDDPTFPANAMRTAFNTKCSSAANGIQQYCTDVALHFVIQVRNIRFAYYSAHAAAFHDLVIADVSQFLGMVANDVSIAQDGTQIQGVGTQPWYSSFVPESWVSYADPTGGVSLNVQVNPDNNDAATAIHSFLTSSLASGSVPFPNTASKIAFLADPTIPLSALGQAPAGGSGSSASTTAASLFLVIALIVLSL